MFGPGVRVVGSEHAYRVTGVPTIFADRPQLPTTVIEADVWIGAGSILMSGVHIGVMGVGLPCLGPGGGRLSWVCRHHCRLRVMRSLGSKVSDAHTTIGPFLELFVGSVGSKIRWLLAKQNSLKEVH